MPVERRAGVRNRMLEAVVVVGVTISIENPKSVRVLFNQSLLYYLYED